MFLPSKSRRQRGNEDCEKERTMPRPRVAVILLVSAILGWPEAHAMTAAERREYLEKLQQILPEVPSFQAWLEKTGEVPPDFDSFPRVNELPDPLHFLD